MITLLVGHRCSRFQCATVCAKFLCPLGVIPIHLWWDQGRPGKKGHKLLLVCPSPKAGCNYHLETGYPHWIQDHQPPFWCKPEHRVQLCQEFCNAVFRVLLPEHITIPDATKLIKVAAFFNNCWRAPQCVGTIDGSHIPIIATEDYRLLQLQRMAFSLQAVVDGKGLFWDVCWLSRECARCKSSSSVTFVGSFKWWTVTGEKQSDNLWLWCWSSPYRWPSLPHAEMAHETLFRHWQTDP